jgi:hypothetical protein
MNRSAALGVPRYSGFRFTGGFGVKPDGYSVIDRRAPEGDSQRLTS